MNVAICHSRLKRVVVKTMAHVPRIGEGVDIWFHPCPRVKDVIWYPSVATRSLLRASGMEVSVDVDVILFVE